MLGAIITAILLGVTPFLGHMGRLYAVSNRADRVVYVQSGRDTIRAMLVPDHDSGTVPNDPTLVEATTNDQSTAFQLSPGQAGKVDLGGKLPGLEDGRHRGAVTTLTPDGKPKDRKQLLIFVDSKPPLIERVEPTGDSFPRSAGALRFRITDPEDGSGVSVDPTECALNVTVIGAALQNKILAFTANELNLTVFVAFTGGAAEHDADFSVSVSLQDRAGNVGHTRETFTIRSLTRPLFTAYRCNGHDTYIQTAGEFLVEPAYSGLALRVGSDRQLDVFTRGCFGKHFRYPEKIREIMKRSEGVDRETESEVVSMNAFFQKAVGERIEVRSVSGNVAVRKMEDGNFKDDRVSFRISQKNHVPLGDQIDTLRVTVPVAFRIDAFNVNLCEAKNRVDPTNEDDAVFHHFPEEAISYTFETIAIPVYLEAAAEPFNLAVEQAGDQLTAQVRCSPIELLDTGASWFEFLGETHWFDRQGDACVAQGPAEEGTVHYKIAAAHKIAEFVDPASGGTSRTLLTEGDIVVCLDPPTIEDFRYHREDNQLKAHIEDQGTPLEDLDIALWIEGYRLVTEFDPATGALTATLPYQPVAVATASLRVTDLARQTTTDSCQVFGDVEPEDNEPKEADAAVHAPHSDSPNTADVDKVLGTTGGGKAIVEICETILQWGYNRNGNFIPISSGPGSVRLVQLRSRDPGNSHASRRAISQGLPLHMEVVGEYYDTRLYEPMPPSSGGVTALSTTDTPGAGRGRDLYFVVMARDGSRTIPINNTGFGFGLFFQSRETKVCQTEERDILAPVIAPTFDTGSQHLTARIHDHGMPLTEIEIEVTARSDSVNSVLRWGYPDDSPGSRPAFTFQDGILTSPFVPPPRGEFFTLRIDAADKAGNRSFVDVDVVVPRNPPEVSLTAETPQSHQWSARNGGNTSAFMTGEARDDSRIVPEKTTLWLDEQILEPLTLYSHTPEAGWRRLSNYKAGYAAGVEEGPHRARFRATDATGLWAETTAAFDLQLAPHIYDFKVTADAVRRIGGPALTAMLIDLGGDLGVDGLTLTIDGQPVDASRLYFDPASGYFAVDGPLELGGGAHRAEIIATDRHGNQARDSLRFTRAAAITTTDLGGGRGLVIESIALMELEHHNGDGQANPGELVRLFITLHNDTDSELVCAGSLASEDLDIRVETESVDYDLLRPDSTVVPMQGYDLRIGHDILEKTISDPYETHFDLTLACDSQEAFVLPLTLPIYHPSIPVEAGMTLVLDRMPPTTTASAIRVQGRVASSAAFIDGMEIRVNGALQGPVSFNREGGRFASTVALTEGANTIEVRAADSNGERGSAAGYIYRTVSFTPPAITITSPAGGAFFVCGDLTVSGTYSTGSGSLVSVTVEAPWGGGSCPVTIVDGSRFTVNCGNVISGPSGMYDIQATLTTEEGFQATDTITISVGDCS